jgi:hypothetical protein
LDYVGGDEAISEIERDNTTGGDGVSERSHGSQGINEAIFLHPGKELVNGLVFLYDDPGCMNMSEHTPDGGVADIYVEYHGHEDVVSVSSGSDFEDEVVGLAHGDSDVSDVPEVMTADDDESVPTSAFPASVG